MKVLSSPPLPPLPGPTHTDSHPPRAALPRAMTAKAQLARLRLQPRPPRRPPSPEGSQRCGGQELGNCAGPDFKTRLVHPTLDLQGLGPRQTTRPRGCTGPQSRRTRRRPGRSLCPPGRGHLQRLAVTEIRPATHHVRRVVPLGWFPMTSRAARSRTSLSDSPSQSVRISWLCCPRVGGGVRCQTCGPASNLTGNPP